MCTWEETLQVFLILKPNQAVKIKNSENVEVHYYFMYHYYLLFIFKGNFISFLPIWPLLLICCSGVAFTHVSVCHLQDLYFLLCWTRLSTSFMKRRHSSSCHGRDTHCTETGSPSAPDTAWTWTQEATKSQVSYENHLSLLPPPTDQLW